MPPVSPLKSAHDLGNWIRFPHGAGIHVLGGQFRKVKTMETAAAMAKSSVGTLSNRYRDAYNVSTRIVRLGNFVKRASLILPGAGAAIEVWRLSLHYEGWLADHWKDDFLLLLIGAAMVSAIGYGCGMLVSAHGQLMSAILDTAVNTSPHLQQSEKAAVMAL